MAYEQYWDDCTIAIRFDDPAIVDEKGHYFENYSVVLSSTQYESGGKSGYFNTVDDSKLRIYPGTSFVDFGYDDFTIAVSFYVSGATGRHVIFSVDDEYAEERGLTIEWENGELTCANNGTGASQDAVSIVKTNVVEDTFYKLMLVRDGDTLRLFLNGATAGTADVTGVYLSNGSSSARVGNHSDGNVAFSGYIDEFYIVKNVALETAAYTPVAFFNSFPAEVDGAGEFYFEGSSDVTIPFWGAGNGAVELGGNADSIFPFWGDASGALDVFGGGVSANFPFWCDASGGLEVFSGGAVAGTTVYVSSGGDFVLSGEAQAALAVVSVASGGLAVSGGATASFPYLGVCGGAVPISGYAVVGVTVTTTATGKIKFSGSAGAYQPPQARGYGALQLSGELLSSATPLVVGRGGLYFSGIAQAEVGVSANNSGRVPLSGTAILVRGNIAAASGKFSFFGASSAANGIAVAGAGAVELSGAGAGIAYQAYFVDCTGEVQLSGQASGEMVFEYPEFEPAVVYVKTQKLNTFSRT